jgi:hypothetical protein
MSMPARACHSPGPVSARWAAISRISESLALLSLSRLQAIEELARLGDADAAPGRAFQLSIQELRLLQSFRGIPDDTRREDVLDAMETICHAYN